MRHSSTLIGALYILSDLFFSFLPYFSFPLFFFSSFFFFFLFLKRREGPPWGPGPYKNYRVYRPLHGPGTHFITVCATRAVETNSGPP